MTDGINNLQTDTLLHNPSADPKSAPVDRSVQNVAQRALTETPTDSLPNTDEEKEFEKIETSETVQDMDFSGLDGATHNAAHNGFWKNLREIAAYPKATNPTEALHRLASATLPSLFLRVPADCSKFPLATSLNLSNNGLTVVPKGIGELEHLVTLDLSRNNFKDSFPESICTSKTLTKLNLSNCQLKTLPDSFGNLQSLTELDLSGNRLDSLPESFSKLSNLKTIHITTGHETLKAAIKKALPECEVITK